MAITGHKRKRNNAVEISNIADSRNPQYYLTYKRAFNPDTHEQHHRKIIKKTMENFGIELKHQQEYTDIIFRTMTVPNGWLSQTKYPLDTTKILRCVEIIEKKIDNIKTQGDITLEATEENPLMRNPFFKQEYQKGYAFNVLKNTAFVTQQEADDFIAYPQINLNTHK